jgi:P-type Cu+ transporter
MEKENHTCHHTHSHSHGMGQKELIFVILAAVLTFPLVFQMVVNIVPLWLQFFLATIVQFVFGWRFYLGSYYSLKHLTANMDLLIALGTSAAYFYSAIIYLFDIKGHTYFESSAAIITLVLLGRYFEGRTGRRASTAIQALLDLQPKQAHVQKGDIWTDIPIQAIQQGDLFQVRPGESVPIDGQILEGNSHVDESMLTGESLPVHKTAPMHVFGGTLNGQGALIARATAVGEQTALSAIIRLVQEAQNSRAPIQNLADAISAIFVPAVVVISILTFLVWFGLWHDTSEALVNAVAVLVIACPCALGMATPTVIMVASGRGANFGILIKNAEALQKAEKLTMTAIDKTGTLTIGKPALTDVIPDTSEIRQYAASLEQHSEHPIGKAISEGYSQKLQVTDFQAISGKGVTALIKGQSFCIGSLSWMQEKGIETDSQVVNKLENDAKTVAVLSDDQKVLGYLGVADTLRPHTSEGVQLLKKQGLKVAMITGDREATARVIAKKVGIETFFAEILPQDKAAIIEKMKKSHQKVAMIGDGINDAPALAAADVGFAMSTGTDIALQASDITLMRPDLKSASDAIDLSKATFRKIRQNLFFAFIYNVLGIPLAAFGLLNPMIAAGSMAASSLCVVINSLLLNKWKPQ